jgi:hypothetical protein
MSDRVPPATSDGGIHVDRSSPLSWRLFPGTRRRSVLGGSHAESRCVTVPGNISSRPTPPDRDPRHSPVGSGTRIASRVSTPGVDARCRQPWPQTRANSVSSKSYLRDRHIHSSLISSPQVPTPVATEVCRALGDALADRHEAGHEFEHTGVSRTATNAGTLMSRPVLSGARIAERNGARCVAEPTCCGSRE